MEFKVMKNTNGMYSLKIITGGFYNVKEVINIHYEGFKREHFRIIK